MRSVAFAICFLICGCADSAREAGRRYDQTREKSASPVEGAAGDVSFRQPGAATPSVSADSSASMGLVLGAGGESATTTKPLADVAAADRQIIYVAELTLVVEDFSRTAKELPALVKKVGGYLSDVSIDRSSGQQRAGRWVARVPVDRFDGFLDELSKLGIPESRHQTAQDVTEEYVDLEARIKNSKRLEDRILKLIDERTGNIKDVTDAEQQLSRVREEIERMEGHLRYLANRAALTTVTINAREEHDYKPPELPGFTTRVASSWTTSFVSLQDFGESFFVSAVYAAPWIVLWAIILLPAIVWTRRRMKRFMADRNRPHAPSASGVNA